MSKKGRHTGSKEMGVAIAWLERPKTSVPDRKHPTSLVFVSGCATLGTELGVAGVMVMIEPEPRAGHMLQFCDPSLQPSSNYF